MNVKHDHDETIEDAEGLWRERQLEHEEFSLSIMRIPHQIFFIEGSLILIEGRHTYQCASLADASDLAVALRPCGVSVE